MKKSGEVSRQNKAVLYFYKLTRIEELNEIKPISPININLFKPTILKLKAHKGRFLLYLFWYIITSGKYRIYYVSDSDRNIIHYSHVLPKFFKFPFMADGDLEIGPCWTDEGFRGKNIYPAVLYHIMNTLCDNKRTFYIMTDQNNIASQKGIEKTGFRFFAKGGKYGLLGIYKPKELLEDNN